MEFLTDWGYIGLFFASFLSATIIPFSSEFVLSFMIANGFNFNLTVLVATIGNWIGALSSYALGWLGNWSILEKYFGMERKKVYNFKLKIDRWGSLLAFFSWVPLFGDLIAVSLGFFKIDFIKVSTFMLLGKMLRYFIWALMTLWGLSFFKL